MKKDTSFRDLILGLILFVAGLYFIFSNARVSTSWFFYVGRLRMSSGVVIVPLLIGLVMKGMNIESKIADLVIGLGVLLILLAIISSVTITFIHTSLFDFVLMFSMTAVGLGLLIKSLFTRIQK